MSNQYNVQLALTAVHFYFLNGAIHAKVDFNSSHPEVTGKTVSRIFKNGESVQQILVEQIPDFPSWINQEPPQEKAVMQA